MRYYVVRCGYLYDFRFTEASDAGAFIANLAANVELDGEEVRRRGSDQTSFELSIIEVAELDRCESETSTPGDPEEVISDDNL